MSGEVVLSGPVFDGRAVADAHALFRDVQREVAGAAEEQWQANMADSFRHSTGRYQSAVNLSSRDGDMVVNDGWPGSGLVYGPWLEGVGSRNSPVTRFPGYFSLRRAVGAVRRRVDSIAGPWMDAYVEKANGE